MFIAHAAGAAWRTVRAGHVPHPGADGAGAKGYYAAVGTHAAGDGLRRLHIQLEVMDITQAREQLANDWIARYCAGLDGRAAQRIGAPPFADLPATRWGYQICGGNGEWRRYHRLVQDRIDWLNLNEQQASLLGTQTLAALSGVLAGLNKTVRP